MRTIKRTAVIGAGTMGSAIAQHFCIKGLEVILLDVNEAGLERGKKNIEASLEEAKQKKIFTEEQVAATLARLTCTTQKSNLKDCDLIVEAVFEDLKIKQNLFRELEQYVSKDCILASNTSSFLITEMAEGLKHPGRVVGVHYFYHAAKNKLVEIIPGKKTSPEIVNSLWNFYFSCDKIPIRVADVSGFAVNRFFVPWLNEAVRLFEEGKGSILHIDEVAREVFQIGMGPFALMNATGVPIARHAAEGLAEKLGSFYAPAERLKKQVLSKTNWDLQDTTVLAGGSNSTTEIRERLLAASLGVAAQMVTENVTDAASTDLGARVGLRWTKGPFELAQEIGTTEVQDMIRKLFSKWGLNVPALPKEVELVQAEVVGKTGFIVFNLPDKLNPLSEQTMNQLAARWEQLDSNPSLETIFITGRGKAFVAGADIKFFLDSIDAKNLDRIVSFTEFGQRVFEKISSSKKKTVAYLNGLTLGGGLELALACKHRIAATNAMLAFPETGIGIYPGLGGTQRTPRLVGRGLAKYLIATGQMLNASAALKYGLVDKVVEPVFDFAELARLEIPVEKTQVTGLPEAVAFDGFTGEITPATFESAELKTYEKVLRRKAPVALRYAMRLVDEGQRLDLSEALRSELKPLKQIFATQDAKVGLSSIVKKTRPEFTGA